MIPDINLLPQRERRTATGKWLIISFGVFFVLVLGFIAYQYVTFSKNIAQLELEEATLQSERETLTVELATLEENGSEDLETSVLFIESISYPVSQLIEELHHYLDSHAYLRNYSFQGDQVSFSVDFETITDVSNYVDDLLRSAYVKDVIVNGMNAFDPVSLEEEDAFKVVNRYANTFDVLIDLNHLRAVGGEKQ